MDISDAHLWGITLVRKRPCLFSDRMDNGSRQCISYNHHNYRYVLFEIIDVASLSLNGNMKNNKSLEVAEGGSKWDLNGVTGYEVMADRPSENRYCSVHSFF